MMPASPSLHTKREVRPMKQTETIRNGQKIVTIHSSEVLLADVPSALDFIMTVRHTCDCDRIALGKERPARGLLHSEHLPCRGDAAKIYQLRGPPGHLWRL